MFTWKNISSFLFDHLTQHCININGFLWLTELLDIVFFSSNMLHYKTKVWVLAAIKQAHTIISAVLFGLNLFNVQSNFACSFGHPMLCRKMMVISYGNNTERLFSWDESLHTFCEARVTWWQDEKNTVLNKIKYRNYNHLKAAKQS